MQDELQTPMHLGNIHIVDGVDPDGNQLHGWIGICYFHNYYTPICGTHGEAEEYLTKHFQTKAAPHPIG